MATWRFPPPVASGSTSTDPVEANAVDISAGNWLDVYSIGGLNTGVQLVGIATAGDGVDLSLGTGIGGAQYTGATIPAGDFLIAADLSLYSQSDFNVAAGVEGVIGVCPGGLGADPEVATWWGPCVSALSYTKPDDFLEHRRHSSTALAGWTGTPFRTGFDGGFGETAARLAIERTGTTITTYLIDRFGTRWQIDTDATATADEAEVILWTRTSKLNCIVHLDRLAIDGLGWEGSQLVGL